MKVASKAGGMLCVFFSNCITKSSQLIGLTIYGQSCGSKRAVPLIMMYRDGGWAASFVCTLS